MASAKVLFLTSRSELGGADFCLLEAIRYLDKERFKPLVGLPGPGPLVDDLLEAGAKVFYLDLQPLEKPEGPSDFARFLVGLMPSTLRLIRVLRQEQVDLVYTNSSAIQTGALAARLCCIPNVWHVREIWTTPKWLIRALNRYIYIMANHIIAISRAVADRNFGAWHSDKITVLYDGIDWSLYAEPDKHISLATFGIRSDKPILGMVTRLVPWKGTHLLLEAAAGLVSMGYDFDILIVGDTPRSIYSSYKDDLLQQVAELGLSGKVFFVGWQAHVSSFLHQMDALVLPSVRPEPFGRVILEAWAAGKPVVASAHGGPLEIIQHGQNGLLFEPNDPGDLTRQLAFLLDHKEQREVMGKVGRRTVLQRFDVQRSVHQIQSICESVICPGGDLECC